MKRLVATLLAIVLCTGCFGADAAGSTSDLRAYTDEMNAFVKAMIEACVSIYEENPDGFTDNHIIMLYRLLSTSLDLECFGSFLTLSTSAGIDEGMVKDMEIGKAGLTSGMDQEYVKWVKGERDRGSFLEYLIKMARISIGEGEQ